MVALRKLGEEVSRHGVGFLVYCGDSCSSQDYRVVL